MKPGDLRFASSLVRTMAYEAREMNRAAIEIIRGCPIILIHVVRGADGELTALWEVLTCTGKMYMTTHEISNYTSEGVRA